MESQQVTAGRTVVVSGDLRELTESINRAARKLARFSKPLDQVRRAAEMLPKPETVKKWEVVKPAFENAPPHEKRRLGNMTISQAFAIVARQARAKVNNFRGGRVPSSARSTRSRSVRRPASRARGPDDPPDKPPLDVVVTRARLRWADRRWLEGAA
jgi:hypothetical protein